MAIVHLRATTSVSSEQFLACLVDSGPGRSTISGNSADDSLQVHSQEHDRADVTEGSGGVWERLCYDWSDPHRGVMRTVDSNTWGGSSGHVYTLTPLLEGGTAVEAEVVREGKNLKGRFVGALLGSIAKGTLAKAFRNTVTAVEARASGPRTVGDSAVSG